MQEEKVLQFQVPLPIFRACDGRVLVTECSGLAIISAYPLKEVEFHQYTWKGTIWDGEDLAGTVICYNNTLNKDAGSHFSHQKVKVLVVSESSRAKIQRLIYLSPIPLLIPAPKWQTIHGIGSNKWRN